MVGRAGLEAEATDERIDIALGGIVEGNMKRRAADGDNWKLLEGDQFTEMESRSGMVT